MRAPRRGHRGHAARLQTGTESHRVVRREVHQQQDDGLAGVLGATEDALADPEVRDAKGAQSRRAGVMQGADSALWFALFLTELEAAGRLRSDLPLAE